MCICCYLKKVICPNKSKKTLSDTKITTKSKIGGQPESITSGSQFATLSHFNEHAFTKNSQEFNSSSQMPLIKENESTGNTELNGDQRGDQVPANQNKKNLVVFETRQAKEKLLVVDLHKIRANMHDKMSQVHDQLMQGANQSGNNHQLNNSGELANLKAQDLFDGNGAGEAAIKAAPVGTGEDNSEECVKMIKAIAENTFRQGLKKHGYKVNSKNAFVAEGGYGMVFRVHKGGQRYACKVISNMLFQLKSDRGPLNTVKLRSRFSNEVNIMKRVSSHPNIINFVESFTDKVAKSFDDQNTEQEQEADSTVSGDDNDLLVFKNFFLVMEYANSKTLSFYVKNRRNLSENIVKGIFRQLADAVKFMHTDQIAHRDIKLSNLLLQSQVNEATATDRRNSTATFNYTIKLCDFGLSSTVDPEDSCFMKPVGTSYYMAPEILRSYFFYNRKKIDQIVPYCAFKGDVWALGVCMFYCLHGFYPLDVLCKGTKLERMDELEKIFTLPETFTSSKTVDEIYANRFRNALRNYQYKLSYNGRELLCRMVEVDPKKRAEIFEVAQHVYLR